jgi:hypothetical protein
METQQQQAKMYIDLLTEEMHAKSAPHRVMDRAELYLSLGLPMDDILSAMKISRATWYRRLDALYQWRADNHISAHRALNRLAEGAQEDLKLGAE